MSKFVRPAAEGADPFGTARLRRGVLDAWATSPARFREDANAEEDLVLGGYRDRLVVELAQNAADASARAGTPGRLRLTLRDGVLVAANTGAPLDEAGVESLATLRASAKRDAHDTAVGRFGVGFAAVLAVTDEPAVVGRQGGVRWALAEARDLAAGTAGNSPGLGDEIRRRDGHVPLLRLPFAAEGTAPDPYDTAVILPLRDTAAEDLAERLLRNIDDALLLALPGLEEVVVEIGDAEVRTLRRDSAEHGAVIDDSRDGTTRYRTVAHHGPLDPALLADRPVEERLRPHWSVTWAVPVDADGAPARPRTSPVVHAPTPSDEALGVPALLIASLPLDTTRRHASPGPLTDFLVERAADAYAELLAAWRPVGTGIIDLVPGPLGKGELDGALRQAILDRLPRTAFLPPAAPPARAPAADDTPADWPESSPAENPTALRPRDAEVVEGAGAETVRVLAEVLTGLLPAGLERRVELRTLGVARVPLTEAVDRLAGLEKDPDWWHRLYESLAGVDPDRLSGLPVPLADGRTTIGPRQILLPTADASPVAPDTLARLGLKVAHPDAAHPLLEKLGALPATPRAVLTTPQVRAAVAASLDDEGGAWDEDTPDAEELADTVLALVRDAALEPGDEPWLGALALPDDEGELMPAGELVLPGSPFAQVMREDELAFVDSELADRWGEQPLAACGVLAGFALVRATDVVLDPDELEPRDADFAEPDDAGLLDAVDVWCEDVLDRLPDSPVPPVATEIVAVRDLDLVDDERWPQALALLAQPPLRDAITQQVRVLLPDGTHEIVRPYTAWWLRGHPVLDGRRPAGLRAAGGDPLLRGLYDEADATGFDDEQVLRALGVRTSVAALLAEPGGAAELLDRLADPDREVSGSQLHALYGMLAELDPEQVTLPDELRAVVDGEVRVVDAADAVVVDSPDLLAFTDGVPLLPVPPSRAAELAELFQVRRLSESVTGEVTSEGAEHDVPESVRVLLGPATPAMYVEHEELVVDGTELDWRRTRDGVLHAATLEGVAAGLAWSAGQWPRRFEVAALLEDPSRTEELARDRWFD
ncbi:MULTISPECIES: sacsin N-terminal ATP-binding-like domain-containing protein [unclassified Streptomyces]|uniref:sacsin N-terminal ATP-binding-like domain-containing protein n=1 Tax=unclassified Streptomyces TaxID=2593676 RepID=UPI0022551EC7|nr:MULTISPECIES: molecular chaperone Hsp90 [unclassified Streptomyces]MCX4990176.1 molecular chaperone Hsp90 [Streptomyces sp. NBC_00568]MCX5004593.1 molecular chaperone Hsp90 [Streptomyces sp. NBC_00638]